MLLATDSRAYSSIQETQRMKMQRRENMVRESWTLSMVYSHP